MRRRWTSLRALTLIAVCAIGVSDAVAQSPDKPLSLREDVRVHRTGGETHRGLFTGWSNDSLSMVIAAGEAVRFARVEIVKIERRRHTTTAQLRRAAVWVGAPMGILGGVGCMVFSGGAHPVCVGAGIMHAAFFGGIAAGVTYLVGSGPWIALPPSAWGPASP